MKQEKLLDRIAPCSLLCYTCTGFRDGPVSACAGQLSVYLEGFCEMRATYLSEDARKAWRSQFDEFHNTLKHMSGGSCPGCRKGPGPGCIHNCFIPDCAKAHGVDFCAECKEFPCREAADFFAARDGRLRHAWEDGNRRLQELGAEAYFKEKEHTSHYIHYKNKSV